MPRMGQGADKTVLLVDPSLFTPPYDAGLTSGLKATGLNTVWAARQLRTGERAELQESDIRVHFYRLVDRLAGKWSKFRAVAKGLSHVGGLIRVLAYVIRNKVEIVHVQWAVVPVLDALAMRLLRPFATVVMTVHDTIPFNGENISFLQNAGFDLPIAAARHVIVHTQAARQNLIGRGIPAEKISVVPHGPLSVGAKATPTGQPRDTRWTFVQFGQIKPYKGVDLVVEAIGALPPASRQKLRVIIAGAPHMDMAAITARVQELQIGDAIEFRLGRLSEQQMADLFDEADSFLMPYRQIDASGVYFLLKPLGKWMIASQVGIFAEDMAGSTHGALVPPGDIKALAKAIEDVSVLRPATISRSDNESWEAIGIKTKQVYEQAAAARYVEAGKTMEPKNHG